MSRVINDKSGYGWCDDARKIPDEILETSPAPRHSRSGQRLRDRPNIGPAHTAGCERQKQQNHRHRWTRESAAKQEQPRAPRSDSSKGLANQRRSSAGGDPPPVGDPAEERSASRVTQIS